MKIKKASASFGKLNGDTLELSEGLNIIKAPNESGKSTWCAFIRTMLFGLNTADRDKAGYLSDKTRYRPWNDKPMEGSMDIIHNGKNITISRTSLGRAPMKGFSAVITGTDIDMPELNGENAGMVLTGVTKPVFERTAFIRQSGMAVTQTGELEKRISSIVSSGDETVSYTEADNRLRSWARRRKSRTNTGTIPTLQLKIKEKLDTLESIRSSSEESARLRDELQSLQTEKQLLEEELKAYDSIEKLEDVRQFHLLKADVESKERDMLALKYELTTQFASTDEDLLNELRADLTALDSFNTIADDALENTNRKKDSLEDARCKSKSHIFRNVTASEADDICDEAELLEKDSVKSRKNAKILTIVFVTLAVITAAAGFFLSSPINLVLWLAAVILIVLTVCINTGAGKTEKKLFTVFDTYNVHSAAELRQEVTAYTELKSAEDRAEADLAAAEDGYGAALRARDEHLAGLMENARKVYADINSYDEIPAVLNKISELKDKHSRACTAFAAAKAVLKAKESSVDLSPIAAAALTPRYDKNGTKTALNNTISRIETVNAAYNMTLGRMRVLGDPMVLESEIRTLKAELDEQTAQYDALTLACEALREADTEIHTRFAPVLAKTAGTIFNRITDGKYDMLAFDKTLDAAAQAKGDTVSKNILYLSEGTADQIYLSLRLAVCELALREGEPCPIILDDAFASFDDARLGIALDYLRELSETRQVLIFSCHQREAAYFENDPKVNIISL